MMKPNAITVLNYLKDHDGENVTAADIAADTGLALKSVNGIVTQAFCRHKDGEGNPAPLAERIPAELENEDGSHKPVKFIVLTDDGRDFVPETPDAE